MRINWKIYYALSLPALFALLFNLFYFQNNTYAIVFGFLYLLYFGLFFGHCFFRKYNVISKLLFGIILLVSYIMISGGIFYYLWIFSDVSIGVICVFAPMLLGVPLAKHPLNIKFQFKKPSYRLIFKILLSSVYLILVYIQFRYLYTKGVSYSINTPWQIVSENFFLVYGASTLTLFLIFSLSRERIFLFFASLHYFLSFSIILFIYKLGFGYDPYLHQASEKMLFANGTFAPKPLYYIGQYSLVVFLSKIFMVPVVFFDRILVPLASSVFLPVAIFQALKDNLNIKRKYILWSVLIFLIIPFANFTYTTPQAFANLLTLVLIFLSISYVSRKLFGIFPLFLIAISICFIHPISGLPAMIFVSLLFVMYKLKFHNFVKFIITALVYFASCLVLPMCFWIYGMINKLDFSKIEQLSSNNLLYSLVPQNIFFTRFVNIFDFIYFYGKNINLLILLISLLGVVFVSYYKQMKKYIVYIMMFSILIINYLIIIKYIKFPFLSVFSERIFALSFYFLLPFFMIGFASILNTLLSHKNILKIFVITFFSGILVVSMYLSYPRSDKYENFKGYSVSDTQYKTVDYIEKTFENTNYLVLADQSLGASLISKYGFRKYFGDEFYYSLPTNIKGNIYQDFINMTKEESDKLKTAYEAAKKTGANIIVFVLNDYWDYTDKLLDEHKKLANMWIEIDGGRAYIFEYVVTKPVR